MNHESEDYKKIFPIRVEHVEAEIHRFMVSTDLGESRAWQEQTDEGKGLSHQVSLHEAKQNAVITLEHIHKESIEGTDDQETSRITQYKTTAIFGSAKASGCRRKRSRKRSDRN